MKRWALVVAVCGLGCMGPGVPSPAPTPVEDGSPGHLVSRVFAGYEAGQVVDLFEVAGSTLRIELENSRVHDGLWLGRRTRLPATLRAVTRHTDRQWWVDFELENERQRALWTFDEHGALVDIAFGDALLSTDILGPPASGFEAGTLCRAGEAAIATCTVGAEKLASVCSEQGALRYRFGRAERVEMSLPANGTLAVSSARRSLASNHSVEQVFARVGQTTYAVVLVESDGRLEGRVSVREDGRLLATLPCRSVKRSNPVPVVPLETGDPRSWAGVWGPDGPLFVESKGALMFHSSAESQPVKQVGSGGVVLGSTDCSLEFELLADHRLRVDVPEDCRSTPAFEGLYVRLP